MRIGKVLKGLRAAGGLTLKDVGRRSGVHWVSAAKLEANKRPGFTVNTLCRLARAFDMTGSELLELIEVTEQGSRGE